MYFQVIEKKKILFLFFLFQIDTLFVIKFKYEFNEYTQNYTKTN